MRSLSLALSLYFTGGSWQGLNAGIGTQSPLNGGRGVGVAWRGVALPPPPSELDVTPTHTQKKKTV